jgi:serpin B
MNILSSVYRESVHFLEQSFFPTLTAEQKRISAIALAALSCLAACYALYYYCSRNWRINASEGEGVNEPDNPIETQKLTEPKNMPKIEAQEKLDYQQGIRAFTVDVLQKKIAESQEDNLLISPLGISFLLSMIKHAVGPEDQAEIERIIHLPQHEDALKVSAYEFIKKLMNNGFDIAGLLYLNPKYRLNSDFQTLASEYYQSKVECGNSAADVNAWAKKVTNGQIKEVITQDDLIDFFVVLANAIHFKAKWATPFEAKDTRSENFAAPTQAVKVDMMHQTNECDYYEDEHCQAIKLTYRKNESSMLLILPKKDNDFSFVNESQLEVIQKGLKSEMVKMALPKFKLEQEVDVKEMLREMGMDNLFKKPDFSPLVDINHAPSKKALSELYISKVKQKSALECDEEGTEASTVTVAIFTKECCMMPPESDKEIRFDRPFLAMLSLGQNPILCGVIRDPSV